MHSASGPLENDDEEDEEDDEMTDNLVQNYAGDDPLPDIGLFSPPRPVKNVRPATLGDTLESPEVIIHNAQQDMGVKMHSWDGGVGGSVEKGGVRLGVTAGNPQYGDRINSRTITPDELLDEVLRHDEVTKENRRRQGLPDTDVDTDDLLLDTPGAIGTILGEHRTIRK
jgi:hypothetical protein